MVRKDLLKRAFRNNFLRKSFQDLKTAGAMTPKLRHKSAFDLRSQYSATPDPDTLTPLPTITDSPSREEVAAQEESTVDFPSLDASPASLPESVQIQHEQPPDARCVPRRLLEDAENNDAMCMTSTEIRQEMDKYDAEEKIKIQSANFQLGYNQLVSNCYKLALTMEEMTASHLDTIETALTILEAIDGLSPHAAALRQELLEKKDMCEEKLVDLLPYRSRVESAQTGKIHA